MKARVRNSGTPPVAEAPPPDPPAGGDPPVSVVVPVLNEEDNIRPLVAEIAAAMAGVGDYEIVYVDDGSADATPKRLDEAMAEAPRLRVLRHNRRFGQSAALRTGVLAARGRLIATLDGDGQNDPADIPMLLEVWRAHAGPLPPMVTGRRARRRDAWTRRAASRLANAVRQAALRDGDPDAGCSLKLYERALFLSFPYFDHMHRYLPALARREGRATVSVPVNHRPRRSGRSKYTNLGRLLASAPDLLGAMWLVRRFPAGLEAEERTR